MKDHPRVPSDVPPDVGMSRRGVLLGLVSLVSAACNHPTPLSDSFGSADEAARAVIAAVAAKNRVRLETIALTEREFREHVWPELPASRTERNLPFSYVWGDLRQKSGMGLSMILERHGGKRYQLQRVRFDAMTPYASYEVHRQSTFDVTDEAGEQQTVQLCGSMIVKGGRWKIFSYVID